MRRLQFSFAHLKIIFIFSLLCCLPPHTVLAENAVNATVGTSGLGLEWSTPLHAKLRVRGLVSYATLERDETEEGIDYTIEFESANIGAILDWHPFAGTFRLSTGLISTSFGLDLESSTSQTDFDIGNSTYTGTNLKLVGDAEFNPVAPYLGFGWASSLARSGLYFSGDLGVMFIGEPKIALNASGQVSQGGGPAFDVRSNPLFQADLEIERQQLEDELEDFSLWPILNFGIGYRF